MRAGIVLLHDLKWANNPAQQFHRQPIEGIFHRKPLSNVRSLVAFRLRRIVLEN